MYTLRKISNQKETDGITNIYIGEWYRTVKKKSNPKNFKRIHQEYWNDSTPSDDIYAYIIPEKGNIFPLYTGMSYFIMTQNGSTFESFFKNKEQSKNIKKYLKHQIVPVESPQFFIHKHDPYDLELYNKGEDRIHAQVKTYESPKMMSSVINNLSRDEIFYKYDDQRGFKYQIPK